VDDCIGTTHDLERRTEVRQVGPDALAVRTAVVDEIGVQDVMTMVTQVADDPAAGLSASARDHDAHRQRLMRMLRRPSVE
jgi:hypothetical protein